MKVSVQVPGPLQKLTNGQEMVEVANVASIEELIDALEKHAPGIKEKLLNDDGEIRGYVNVFVNDDDIRFSGGKAARVQDGDCVVIVPSIAGGA